MNLKAVGSAKVALITMAVCMSNALPTYQQNHSDVERASANDLISLEKSALDKWFNGDISGDESLWPERSFSYFDGVVIERVDDYETIQMFLKSIDGKILADDYEFLHPQVQDSSDLSVVCENQPDGH